MDDPYAAYPDVQAPAAAAPTAQRIVGPGVVPQGVPATPEQMDYARSMAHLHDPQAPLGSPTNPSYDTEQVTGDDSIHHVTTGGKLSAPAGSDPYASYPDAPQPAASTLTGSVMDDRPVDQGLGFKEGLNTVAKNLTDVLGVNVPGLPRLPGAAQAIMHPLPILAHGFEQMVQGQTDKAEQTARPGKIGKVTAEVLASAPFAMEAEAPLISGALQGFMTSDAKDPAGKIIDTALGAAGGKLADGAVSGVRSLVLPKIRPAAQWAMDNDIRLTPGMTAGGWPLAAENGATRMVLAGPLVRGAQSQTLDDFNRAAINSNVLAPAGLPKLGRHIEAGNSAIDAAHEATSGAYGKLLPSLSLKQDPQLGETIATARNAAQALEPTLAARLNNVIDTQLLGKADVDTGAIAGRDVKDLDSYLGSQRSTFAKSIDPFHNEYASAVGDLQQGIREGLERSNPDQAGQLSKLNSAWANLMRIERAGAAAKQQGGVFTPKDIINAAAAMDTRSSTARGTALLQNWANQAKEAGVPLKIPDGGKWYEKLPELFVMGDVAKEGGGDWKAAALAAAEAGASAMYSPWGRGAANALMTKRGPIAADISRRLDAIRPVAAWSGATALPKAAQLVLPQLPGQARP